MTDKIPITALEESYEHVAQEVCDLSQKLAEKYGMRIAEVELIGHDQKGQFKARVTGRDENDHGAYHKVAAVEREGKPTVNVLRCYLQMW